MQTHIVLRQATNMPKTCQYASSSFCNWNTSKHSHKIGIISSVRQFCAEKPLPVVAHVFSCSHRFIFLFTLSASRDMILKGSADCRFHQCHCFVPKAWRAETWSNSFYVGPYLAREYAYLPDVEFLELNCAAVSFLMQMVSNPHRSRSYSHGLPNGPCWIGCARHNL